MEPISPLLGFVKEKFPQQGHQIDALYQSNPDFQTLCADYFACVQALNKFHKLSFDGLHATEEYNKLRIDLEEELKKFLTVH